MSVITTNITRNSHPGRKPLIFYAYLGFLVIIFIMMPLTIMKNFAGAEISRHRYFLPVSILFFKTLVSIVSSIWYRYRPIPTYCSLDLHYRNNKSEIYGGFCKADSPPYSFSFGRTYMILFLFIVYRQSLCCWFLWVIVCSFLMQ